MVTAIDTEAIFASSDPSENLGITSAARIARIERMIINSTRVKAERDPERLAMDRVFIELEIGPARASQLSEMESVVEEMQKRCQYMHSKYLMDPKGVDPGGLMLPHWLCQPYFRPLPGSEEAKPIVKQVGEGMLWDSCKRTRF